MRHYKITLFFFCLLVGFSCQNDLDRQPVSEYKNKITAFTSSIKSNNESYVSQIEELEKAIDFRTVKKHNLITTEKLLIADLSGLKKLHQADQLRVIFFLNNNEVARAQIVAFENNGNTDPNQVIASILNMQPINGYSGKVSFYSVFQAIQLSSTFSNGELRVNSMARKVDSAPPKNGKTNSCTDWYLITTYHYEGGGTQTVEVYLFTTCDEPCGFAGARVNCGGGGSGGGGGVTVPSTQFPSNPQDADIYETTDSMGFYTKYVYDAARMIWVGIERILPGIVLQDNPSAYPFLQDIRWPVDGQVVLGPDNMAYTYNGSSGSWVGELEAGIDCASFNFVKTTFDAYWQECAIVNIKLNVFILDASTGRVKSRSHTISRPVWFGIPTKLASGQIIVPGQASEMAATAETLAHRDIANDYIDREFVSDAQIEQDFINYVSFYLQGLAGKCDFHGSGSPLVTPQHADYLLFGNGDCY
jgi:hypothetical protein